MVTSPRLSKYAMEITLDSLLENTQANNGRYPKEWERCVRQARNIDFRKDAEAVKDGVYCPALCPHTYLTVRSKTYRTLDRDP